MNWMPNTCACVFNLNPDCTLNQVLNACSYHPGTGNAVFDAALEDNRYVNNCIAALVTAYGIDPSTVSFSFDQNMPLRNLSLTVTGLTAQQILTAIQGVTR